MKKFFKTLFFYFITIPLYKSRAKNFGIMIAYSHEIGADRYNSEAQKISDYMDLCMEHNIRPWSYQEMRDAGYGKKLPRLTYFESNKEMQEWILTRNKDRHQTNNQIQIEIGKRIIQDLRNLKK